MEKGKSVNMKKTIFLFVSIGLVLAVLFFAFRNKSKAKDQNSGNEDLSKKRIQKALDKAGGYAYYYISNKDKFGSALEKDSMGNIISLFEPHNKEYIQKLKDRASQFGRTLEQELGIDSIWDQNKNGHKTRYGDITQEEFNIARRIIIENKYPNWKA